MPTSRICYVDAASTGGDGTTAATSGANAAYATLHAALVAEYAANPNLVTADILLTIECQGSTADTGAFVDTTTCPFTTDSTRYVIIETPLAQRGATPWIWSTSRYRWTTSTSTALWGARNFKVVLRGLQLETTRNATDAKLFNVSPNSSGTNVTIEECLWRFSGAANAGTMLQTAGSSQMTIFVRNNIFLGTTPTTTGTGWVSGNTHASTATYLDSNTWVGFKGTAISGSASNTVTARNNLVDATTCFSGTITQSYNASTDATASGTGSRTSQTFTYSNAGAGDYRLGSGDTGAKGYGTDLRLDANDPFSTDYVQAARGATWDIGASQLTASGSLAWFSIDSLMRGMERGMAIGTR